MRRRVAAMGPENGPVVRLTPKRKSLSRLWPVADQRLIRGGKSSSRRSRNCPESPYSAKSGRIRAGGVACAKRGGAADTVWSGNFRRMPVPGRQMAGYATSEREWH